MWHHESRRFGKTGCGTCVKHTCIGKTLFFSFLFLHSSLNKRLFTPFILLCRLFCAIVCDINTTRIVLSKQSEDEEMEWCCFKNSTLKIHILACEERESHLKVENEKFLLFFLVQFPHQLFFLPTGNNVNNFAGSLLSVSSWSLTFSPFLFSCSFIMKYRLFKMNTHWRWNMAANRWKDRRRLVGLISICCEYGMRWIFKGEK